MSRIVLVYFLLALFAAQLQRNCLICGGSLDTTSPDTSKWTSSSMPVEELAEYNQRGGGADANANADSNSNDNSDADAAVTIQGSSQQFLDWEITSALRKSHDLIAADEVRRLMHVDQGNVIYSIGSGDGSLLINLLRGVYLSFFIMIEANSTEFRTSMEELTRRGIMQYGLGFNANTAFSFLDEFSYESDFPGRCQFEIDKNIPICQAFHTLSPYMGFLSSGRPCPHVIIIQDALIEQSDKQRTYFLLKLMSLSKILEFCPAPIIYMQDIKPYNAELAIKLLLDNRYSYSELFWNVYPIEAGGHSTLGIDLVAVGTHRHIELRESISKYVQVSPGKYLISEYPEVIDLLISHSSVFTSWSASCLDGGIPPCRFYVRNEIDYKTYNYKSFVILGKFETEARFYIDYLHNLPPIKVSANYSYLMSSAADMGMTSADIVINNQIIEFVKSIEPSIEVKIFEFDYKQSLDGYIMMSIYQCKQWIKEIQLKLIPNHNLVSIYDANTGSYEGGIDFIRIVKILNTAHWQCAYFVNKAANTLRRTHANVHRSTAEVVDSVFPVEDNRNDDFFDPLDGVAFRQRYDPDNCFEPIYCSNSMHLLNRIEVWQNPRGSTSEELVPESIYMAGSRMSRKFSCAQAKYLVFQPLSNMHGIGSLFTQILSALRFAICYNRILIYAPAKIEDKLLAKWKIPGCASNMMDCYFEPLSHCASHITDEEILQAPRVTAGYGMELFVNRNARILVLENLPMDGKCSLCNDAWTGSTEIFDGLNIHSVLMGVPRFGENSSVAERMEFSRKVYNAIGDPMFGDQSLDVNHYSSYLSTVKAPWMSFMLRYVLRFRPWFSSLIQDIASTALIGPNNKKVVGIPRPFASLHVRYGAKRLETDLQALDRYMKAMKKRPHIKNIFVSTETEKVIGELKEQYPEYNFYFIKYDRMEILDFFDSRQDPLYKQDFVDEFIYSMVNLFVAVEANTFIGSLSSNWCSIINYLQRTRGDGGDDYLSVDGGSVYSVCF